MITQDSQVTQQINTLWQPHGSQLAFTVAEAALSLPNEKGLGPPMTVRWGMPRPKLHKLSLVQMSSSPGPVPKQGKKMTIPHKAAPEVIANHVSSFLPKVCWELRF